MRRRGLRRTAGCGMQEAKRHVARHHTVVGLRTASQAACQKETHKPTRKLICSLTVTEKKARACGQHKSTTSRYAHSSERKSAQLHSLWVWSVRHSVQGSKNLWMRLMVAPLRCCCSHRIRRSHCSHTGTASSRWKRSSVWHADRSDSPDAVRCCAAD